MIVLKATQDKVLRRAAIGRGHRGAPAHPADSGQRADPQNRHALQLTTSDLEIQIRTTAELDGDAGDFTTTVGARKLIDILRTMPSDQTVSLESSAEQADFERRQKPLHAANPAGRRLSAGAGSGQLRPGFSACRKRC